MSYSVLEALRSNPDYVRKVLAARRMDTSLVDKFLELDARWRQLRREVDELRHLYNQLSREGAKATPDKRREIAEKARELALGSRRWRKSWRKLSGRGRRSFGAFPI